MKKRNSAGVIALCGVLGALAVVVMLGGEIIPLATFCCPVLVMFMMIPVIHECGKKMAFVWYMAVSILSMILTFANPEATLIFVFLGYYPIVRRAFGRIRPRVLQVGCKLVFFNGSVAVVYSILIFLFRLDAILQEFQQTGTLLAVAMILLANVCFFLTEKVLDKFEVYYIVHLRKKFKFK